MKVVDICVNYRRESQKTLILEMLQLSGFMKVVGIYVNLTGRSCVNYSGYLYCL